MTEQELQVIRQSAELATPGPWEVRNDNEGTDYRPFYVISEVDSGSGEWFVEIHVGCENDAKFIARARQDVPALIADVERYKETYKICEKAMFKVFDMWKETKLKLDRTEIAEAQARMEIERLHEEIKVINFYLHENDYMKSRISELINENNSLRKALDFND